MPSRITQITLFCIGGLVVIYAIVVLIYVSLSYQLGLRSVLNPNIIGEPHWVKAEDPEHPPQSNDTVVAVGDLEIRKWWDLLQAPGTIHEQIETRDFSPQWLEMDQEPLVRVEYRSA